MLKRVLAGSRYVIFIAVIGSFLASLTVLVYDGLTVLNLVYEVMTHGGFTLEGAKHLELESIELIDLFLVGAVLYIVALGLYDLFIDDTLPMPSWLKIADIEDLKSKLIGVIIVLLAVTFLAEVVDWNGSMTIIGLGVGVGLVLFALGYLVGQNRKHSLVEQPTEGDSR